MDKTEIEKRRSGRKSSCRLGGSSWLAVLSACCACCCMRPRHYHIQQNVYRRSEDRRDYDIHLHPSFAHRLCEQD